MKHNLQRSRLSAALLVLPFLYSAQISPYIHFHHTHGEDAFEFVISIHPADQPTENHVDHEAGDHEHNALSHVTGDWDYTKNSLRQALIQPLSFYTLTVVVTSDDSNTPFPIQSIDHHLLPRPAYISPDIPRGPPQLV